MGRIGEFFRDIRMGPSVVHLTQDPNVAIVEFEGRSVSNETGAAYEQNYVSVVTFRDGRIAHIKEYYNPIRVLVTTGEIEEPGG